MAFRPNHLAAMFYAILALFLAAVRVRLSYPVNHPPISSLDWIRWVFSPENENRAWFVWFAFATISAPILTALFLWSRASSRSIARILVVAAALYLCLSLWHFDSSIIFCAGAAFVCALSGWWRAA